MRLRRGETKTRSSPRQVRRSQRCRLPPARGRLSYEQSRRHSLGSSRVHSECARYASFLSLRLVWKRCPGRGSAANAKNASTPPLDTDNIGFEPPTRIGNSTWIVRIAFSQTPFPQTVNSPQHKIAREPSSCRQLHDNGKGGIFCFPQFC